jgi:hypothetical protein
MANQNYRRPSHKRSFMRHGAIAWHMQDAKYQLGHYRFCLALHRLKPESIAVSSD